MGDQKRFVGIDVAKAQLEVFIRPDGKTFSVANDGVGIGELLRQLKPADFVILEATGGLEMPVASALAAAGFAVVIVNPRQVIPQTVIRQTVEPAQLYFTKEFSLPKHHGLSECIEGRDA